MAHYSLAHAQSHLSELIDRAKRGEEVVIDEPGEAVVRLLAEAANTSQNATPIGEPIDLEWLRAHRITPQGGANFDSAALIRQMRDEGY